MPKAIIAFVEICRSITRILSDVKKLYDAKERNVHIISSAARSGQFEAKYRFTAFPIHVLAINPFKNVSVED
jgi:hypothetical protein